jgi:hypothetical protein
MQPSEALGTAAQAAVAIAGFAGIIVAFRSHAVHQWDAIDKFRLRLLLSNSVLSLTFSLFALLLLSVKPTPTWIWRTCSGFAIVLEVPFGMNTRKGARSLSQYQNQGITHAVYILFAVLGLGALLLQAVNLVFLNAFWAFFASIFVHLVAGAFQFVRMIIVSYDRPNES